MKNNKLFLTTIIIVITLAVIVGGVFYFDYKKADISNSEWKTYTSEQFGFSFEYPAIWGDVSVYSEPKEENMERYFSYDLKKDASLVTQEKYRINFENKPCNSGYECYLYFDMLSFSPEKPLEALCEEGSCDGFKNLVDDKIFLENNHTQLMGGHKAYCRDGYSNPYSIVFKECKTYNNNTRIELGFSYSLRGHPEIDIKENNISLINISGQLNDSIDFDQFVSNYERVLNSIIFLN